MIKFRKYVLKNFKKIDVIINCAGIYGEIGRFDKINFKLWKRTIEVNLFGTALICKYFIDLLLKSKTKKIINFSGGGAFNSFPNFSAYACSKAAVVRFTENLAEEFKRYGVTINCIAPGFNATAMQNDVIKAGKSKVGKNFYHFVKKEIKKNRGQLIDIPIKCVNFLINNNIKKISGRTISANFDDWSSSTFKKIINNKKNSELFYLRRINLENRRK